MNPSDRSRSASPADPTRSGLHHSGNILPRSGSPSAPSRYVTGIWSGASAAHPGSLLTGQHGELRMEVDGSYSYHCTLSRAEIDAVSDGLGCLGDVFTLNLSNSAGSSCVARLDMSIRPSSLGPQICPSFKVLSTVTERYCLTAHNGLALLCMETGDHFEMCRLDTPMSAVARSHNREFFGVGGQHLLRLDPINGNTIWIGILAQPRRIVALESAPDGMLYGIDTQGDLYRIQPSNGSTTLLVRLGRPSLSRGAIAHVDNRLLWTAADNRLHAYDLDTATHSIVLADLQPPTPICLHEHVLAMMPAMDGKLFMATRDEVIGIHLLTGDWVANGVRGRLDELMGTDVPSGPVWGGREPGQPMASDHQPEWASCGTVLQPH